MKNLIYLFILSPFFAVGQNSLLWKVTSGENNHVSYLFGSMHTNDSLLNTFDHTWWEAFGNCQVFAGEVNAQDKSEMMEAFNAGLMKDTTLSDLLNEEEMERVRKFVLSKADLSTAMILMRMKPFYIMAAISELPDNSGPYKEVMDLRLQSVAVKLKKKVVGLETNMEQAESVGAMPLADQAKMLLDFIDEGEKHDAEKAKIMVYYKEQNLDGMMKIAKESETTGDVDFVMNTLIGTRNDRFIKRLLPLLESSNVFCAVGALHLPGEYGMIEQLRRMGYKVEPIHFEFKASQEGTEK